MGKIKIFSTHIIVFPKTLQQFVGKMHFSVLYEGRSINKLQNGAISSIFKIEKSEIYVL